MLPTQGDEVLIIQSIHKGKQLARRSSYPDLRPTVPSGVTQRVQSLPQVPRYTPRSHLCVNLYNGN
jgi:hypothetical protein